MSTHQTAKALVFSALLSVSISIGWDGERISPEIIYITLEQLVNHSGTPSVLFGSPVSLWMTFAMTPESQVSRDVAVATEVMNNTYMSSLLYNMTDEGDFGSYHVGVHGEMLIIDYESPVFENNTVLPTASFITQNVIAAETVKSMSLFCVFHGDIMDIISIPGIPRSTCSSENLGTNYYLNRTNLNSTSVGEISAGDYNYSCNAVSTNKSVHLPPGNILDSNMSIFALLNYQNISPQDINIKMNASINFTWIIYGKNVPNYYDMSAKMDNKKMVTQKSAEVYCGLIVLAYIKVNFTEVKPKFALCEVLRSGELDFCYAERQLQCAVAAEHATNDISDYFWLVIGVLISLVVIIGILIKYCLCWKSSRSHKPSAHVENGIADEEIERTLKIEDLVDVLELLSDLTTTKYMKLGLKLGLLAPTLSRPEIKREEYGLYVMQAWLNQEDKVKNPTWKSLIAALESRLVGQKVTAQQVRQWLTSR